MRERQLLGERLRRGLIADGEPAPQDLLRVLPGDRQLGVEGELDLESGPNVPRIPLQQIPHDERLPAGGHEARDAFYLGRSIVALERVVVDAKRVEIDLREQTRKRSADR